MTIFEDYIDKLNWAYLSENPNLTPALIEKYKGKLNWEYLSANPSLFAVDYGIVNHMGWA
jgi:hypothetical protein